MNRIKETISENSMEMTWEEVCYFGFFILLSVTKGLGLYEGQKLFELLVLPAFLFALMKLIITPYTKRQWAMQVFFFASYRNCVLQFP